MALAAQSATDLDVSRRETAQRALWWKTLPSSSKDMTNLRPLMMKTPKDGSRRDQDDLLPAELDTLNDQLETLAAIFPDVQVEVFRDMLMGFAEESRLHVVTEALLRQKAQWVRGRWRTPEKAVPPSSDVRSRSSPEPAEVPAAERFRTQDYKNAVRKAFYQEFRGLPRSTIEAVLAEHNYSYTMTRPTLLTLSSKTWWASLSSFLLRRKAPPSSTLGNHPLVVWRPKATSSSPGSVPSVKPTGSPELDQELLATLITPLRREMKEEQETKDREFALHLNQGEAELCDAFHDCECCFVGTTFEQLSHCDRGCHLICFHCIRQAVSEAVFGQGWSKNVETERGTLRCIAPNLGSSGGECGGCVSREFLYRALVEEKGGKELIGQFEERLARDVLTTSKVVLVRCPFCMYAEEDDSLEVARRWRFKHGPILSNGALPALVIGITLLSLLPPLFSLAVSLLLLVYVITIGSAPVTTSLVRILRRRRGLKFTCQSPTCGRPSCLSCGKEWRDIHICYESERVALRAHVERAMAEAVKRTCPRCHLSFVKASGCNKLTCVCGYHMCYVCRREIGSDGYRHFCEHFRPLGHGPCAECNKCDLYRCEDDALTVKRAAALAEKEWRAQTGIHDHITWHGKGDLRKPGLAVVAPDWPLLQQQWWIDLLTAAVGGAGQIGIRSWEDVVDAVVDKLIEVS